MNRNMDEGNVHKEVVPVPVPVKPAKPVVEKKANNFVPQVNNNNSEIESHKVETINSNELETHAEQPKILKPKPTVESKNLRVVKNIGFENLPNQIYRRSLFNGFELNVMVVGCSGLGKSTFINSLFLTDIYGPDFPPTSKRSHQTTEINSRTVNICENNVQLRLTLIDTPGFGESVDNRECWRPILDYVEARYNEHMLAQSRVNRTGNADSTRSRDCRVHVCLYFLEPTGHRLKPLDVEFMRHLHTRVNVVPIIAKADCMMPDECSRFKAAIMDQLRKEAIHIYDFPEEAAALSLGSGSGSANISIGSGKVRESTLKDIIDKRQRLPFAIVSSNVQIEKNGIKVRGRAYPWGVVEMDNLEHNDFPALRSLLLSSHLQDLLDTTDRMHYEHHRAARLSTIAIDSKFAGVLENGRDPMTQMDEERRQFEQRIRKMEQDMQLLFDSKVHEKTKRYEDRLAQIATSQQDWESELVREAREQEIRRSEFESERLLWEESNRDTTSSLRASVDTLDIKDKKKGKWHLKG